MSKTDSLVKIFRLQRDLQVHIGSNPEDMDDPKLVEYIRVNILALEDELHEAMDEVYWKPWAKSQPPGFKDKEKYKGELIDALHFLVNLCLAAGMTPGELIDLYEGKSKVNHERQDRGYTGTDKCDGPGCNRALDEPSITRIVKWNDFRFCSQICYLAAIEAEGHRNEDTGNGHDERAERVST